MDKNAVVENLALILALQLMGEVTTRSLSLTLPGPVIGMIYFLCLLALFKDLSDRIAPTANTFLAHLSLLFVPAGVGIIQQINALGGDVWKIALTIAITTPLAILAGTYAFLFTLRLMGREHD